MKIKKIVVLLLAVILVLSVAGCKKDNGGETTTAPTTAKPTTAPTTAEPTTPETPSETALEEEMIVVVDSLTSYYSIGENLGWQNAIYTFGETNTGKQYVSFMVTPAIDKVDGSVDFADSGKTVTGFSDLSMLVRLNADGFFDVRNGDNMEKLADVAYTAGNAYLVEVVADFTAKTYSVYVTAPEGESTMVAENYAFRTTANDADDLGKMFIVSAAGNDQLTVESVKRLEVYDAAKEYLSTGENFGWQQKGIYLGREYSGKIRITYDMTKLIEQVDASVDFTDGAIDVFGFGDLAMLIRINIEQNVFDVRNVEKQDKLADVSMEKDKPYHFEVEADMDAKIYSVWVTAPTGERVQIAKDYGFRATANHADSISKVYVISAHENDSMKMTNLTIEEVR